jgi:hypothetical protein
MTLRREFALTRAKRTGMWWFDFFGGYYYADPLMNEVANMVRVKDRLQQIPMQSVSQVAVFGDGPSMYFASATSSLSESLLLAAPVALRRIGAPFDVFSLADLDNPRLPLERYKLVIFLNTFAVSESKRAFIEKKVKAQGRTILWLYAPGYIEENGFSLEAMHSLTDINLAHYDGPDSKIKLKKEDVLSKLSNEIEFGFTKEVSPLFHIDDPEVKVLGYYASGGQAAVGYKKMPDFTSFYCATGNVPTALFREIARAAGVHIYYEGNDPIYVNSRLIGIHLQADSRSMLTLPGNMETTLEELFDGGELTVTDGRCDIPRETGVMKLYLVNDQEIDA